VASPTALFGSLHPKTPSPLGDCVITGKKVVIPAQAGIQAQILLSILKHWMPSFAGMTNYDTISQGGGISLSLFGYGPPLP